MTKKEFLHHIAEKTNMSLGAAEVFLDAVVDTLQGALTVGDEVNLPGLGKFDVQAKAARRGRNPATGEMTTFPARTKPRFKPSSVLLALLNAEAVEA